MIKRIAKNNKIFSSIEFERDKHLFSTILNDLSSDKMLYSDEQNYIFCYHPGFPIWIWTKSRIAYKCLQEIEALINLYVDDKKQIICKSDLYKILFSNNEDIICENNHKISFYECHNIIKPKICSGSIYIPTVLDIPNLIDLYYESNLEVKGFDALSREDVEKKITNLIIKNDNNYYNDTSGVYAWKDNNKIVSFAIYSSIGDMAKIDDVFTSFQDRHKGYASNLIYCVTKEIINEGIFPIVYISNNNGNNLYKNIGYQECGELINFTCRVKYKRR